MGERNLRESAGEEVAVNAGASPIPMPSVALIGDAPDNRLLWHFGGFRFFLL